MTATVRIMPVDITIEVGADESLMAAAQRQGFRWPTVCHGQGTCRTCFVEVCAGVERCSPISTFEGEGIGALRKPLDGATRLACQVRFRGGEVTVLRRGIRTPGNSAQ